MLKKRALRLLNILSKDWIPAKWVIAMIEKGDMDNNLLETILKILNEEIVKIKNKAAKTTIQKTISKIEEIQQQEARAIEKEQKELKEMDVIIDNL